MADGAGSQPEHPVTTHSKREGQVNVQVKVMRRMAEWKLTAEAFNGCNELQTKKKVYRGEFMTKSFE